MAGGAEEARKARVGARDGRRAPRGEEDCARLLLPFRHDGKSRVDVSRPAARARVGDCEAVLDSGWAIGLPSLFFCFLSNIYAGKELWEEAERVRSLMRTKLPFKNPGSTWFEDRQREQAKM